MIIIGGLGTSVGSIFGAVFIQMLNEVVIRLSPTLQSSFPGLPSGFTVGLAPMIFAWPHTVPYL
jgi:ABC-type branched-subunit amino acid transport system permease subunit